MAYIHQLAAVQYFQLASWWENVPYVISYDNSFAVTKQLVSRLVREFSGGFELLCGTQQTGTG